jgi:hypothetical protein
MGIDKQGKLDIIAAQKGPLEHELFAAQVHLETQEVAVDHGSTGVTKEHVEEAKARRDAIQAQLDSLDEKAKEIEGE